KDPASLLAVVITKRNYNGLLTLLYCPPRYLLFCAFLISGNYCQFSFDSLNNLTDSAPGILFFVFTMSFI
ncbi:hypothetical protein, partial [Klebsiella pneumoniae]|uniref:hypothetical protein n=1 Tax=Klebsiella pneumoniae TaxID=573 RepID=UPI001950E156